MPNIGVAFRATLVLLGGIALAGCGDDKCADDQKIDAFADLDGDGFGAGDAIRVCSLGDDQVDNADDCDDATGDIRPGAQELCNGLDDNCDSVTDEGLTSATWYKDTDLDGYGVDDDTLAACAPPDETWAALSGDCDDDNLDVNPGATEICNEGLDDNCDTLADDDVGSAVDASTYITYAADGDGDGFPRAGATSLACLVPAGAAALQDVDGDGTPDLDCADNNPDVNPGEQEICNTPPVDDDCDGLRDDLDDSVDPAGFQTFQADADGDGDGDPYATVMACNASALSGAAANSDDCNDADAAISTKAPEVLCDLVDNDCDKATLDDKDTDVDTYTFCGGDCADNNAARNPGAIEIPSNLIDENCDTLEACYQDVDLDGSRTSTTVDVADPQCDDSGNARADQPLDCDDNDAAVTHSGEWEADADLDGFGDGVVVLTQQCTDPGPGYVLIGGDLDCNDGNSAISPGQAVDACNDGVDADCDTFDTCATCGEYLATGETTSGVYTLRPSNVTDVEREVYCDMTTDGGGWTLVASSATDTPNDVGGVFYTDLGTLEPAAAHTAVWAGLGDVVNGDSDMRFACKLNTTDTAFEVDLSFYATPWYDDIAAAGTDGQSCFSESGAPDQPARRNNLTGVFKADTDAWDGGALVGEDTCNDVGDFTVDFDDRGIAGNGSDGTDWGEADGKVKCGDTLAGAAWFIFVRE